MDSDYQILQNNPVSDLRKALTHYNSETKIIGISKLKKEALVSTIKNRFKPPKISTQNGDIMLDARDIAIDTYRLKPKKKKEKKVSKPDANRTIKIKKKKKSKPMTLEEYEEEEDQKAAKEFKRKKKISEKEDLTRFNRTIKEIEYFFNTEKGSYKNSRSIKSGKDLKEIYNNVLLRLKNSKKSKEFTIPESVELKIKKKLK